MELGDPRVVLELSFYKSDLQKNPMAILRLKEKINLS